LYVPDYIANSGGVINVAAEIGQIYDRQNVKTRVGLLNEKLKHLLEIADIQSITPLAAANMLAEARLQGRRFDSRSWGHAECSDS
jgi:glutamate dehydrogenase/leucine dehydrogenase